MWLYRYRLDRMKRGSFIGIFFIVLFGMRFLIEFIKEPQVGFEETMVLNMGQLLSIPFIIAGICLLVYSRVRNRPAMIVQPARPKHEPVHHAHGSSSRK